MKTLFKQLDELYFEIDKYFYDELTDYEKGVKDILNMLDVRMSGNDENGTYNYIMNEIKQNHGFNYEYYYQIDYIDKDGRANYIETYKDNERSKALYDLKILNVSNMCLNGTTTRYVLDRYRYKLDTEGRAIDDTDEIIEEDIKE